MIYIITAMTSKGVIGKGNNLPWNIPDELKNFKSLTTGHTVIMGLKTYQSIGRPLPNRHNIVLSHENITISGVEICTSAQEALNKAYSHGTDIFIIGGAYTYEQFLPIADRLYISYIKHDYDGDVFFPAFDASSWESIEVIEHPEFTRVLYTRKNMTQINNA